MSEIEKAQEFIGWCRAQGATKVKLGFISLGGEIEVEFGTPRVEFKESDPLEGLTGEQREAARKKQQEERLYGSA